MRRDEKNKRKLKDPGLSSQFRQPFLKKLFFVPTCAWKKNHILNIFVWGDGGIRVWPKYLIKFFI
jgi:hypothetical protein